MSGEERWELDGPVPNLGAALPHLRRPPAAAAIRWKVQSEWAAQRSDPSKLSQNPGGLVIAYIDARLVIERLNLVAGQEWSDAYTSLSPEVEECALTVFGTTRRDVGHGSGPPAMLFKARRSDALKRAGVKFGIGVSVYAMKRVVLPARGPGEDGAMDRGALKLKKKRVKRGNDWVDSWTVEIHPGLESYLADLYAAWLELEPTVAQFGPALDHGDELGAQGAEEETVALPPEAAAAGGDEPEAGAEVGSPELNEALEEIQTRYKAIRALNGAALPPKRHREEKEAAILKGVEGLKEYAAELAERLAAMEAERAS